MATGYWWQQKEKIANKRQSAGGAGQWQRRCWQYQVLRTSTPQQHKDKRQSWHGGGGVGIVAHWASTVNVDKHKLNGDNGKDFINGNSDGNGENLCILMQAQ